MSYISRARVRYEERAPVARSSAKGRTAERAKRARLVTYDPRRLEWATRFAYSPQVAALLRRFARVRPGMRIVELGCGSGFWGRLLAAGLRGEGTLLGIDLDASLVRRARLLAREEGLSLARYRVGDATRTGVPAGSADLVTCHRLLCVVPDPAAVVREMKRIARRGGRVVANEHDHSADIFWDPDDPELASLADRRNAAWVKGSRKVYGGDHAVGSRVAELFLEAGLDDVGLVGVLAPSGPLPFDATVDREEVAAFFAWLAEDARHPDPFRVRVYAAGGWSRDNERRFLARARQAILERLHSDGDLRRWGRVSLVPRVVVRARVP